MRTDVARSSIRVYVWVLTVLVRQVKGNQLTPCFNPTPGRILKVKGSQVLVKHAGKFFTRNNTDVKKIRGHSVKEKIQSDDDSDGDCEPVVNHGQNNVEIPENVDPGIPPLRARRNPERIRRRPDRLRDYVWNQSWSSLVDLLTSITLNTDFWHIMFLLHVWLKVLHLCHILVWTLVGYRSKCRFALMIKDWFISKTRRQLSFINAELCFKFFLSGICF